MIKTLIVDDDDASRTTLAALLEDERFVVTEAKRAEEGLALIEASPFDLVILDQHIGDALGSDLVPKVRARCEGVRVVIVSGSSTSEVEGGDAFFAKGGRFEDLLETLRRVLAF